MSLFSLVLCAAELLSRLAESLPLFLPPGQAVELLQANSSSTLLCSPLREGSVLCPQLCTEDPIPSVLLKLLVH